MFLQVAHKSRTIFSLLPHPPTQSFTQTVSFNFPNHQAPNTSQEPPRTHINRRSHSRKLEKNRSRIKTGKRGDRHQIAVLMELTPVSGRKRIVRCIFPMPFRSISFRAYDVRPLGNRDVSRSYQLELRNRFGNKLLAPAP
ncbi:hypothetical protein JTE90_010119 [Oedothorax gibbosus]|uniref:Uncharacterized protein n=1 Tax=Oedothorax gibbosus TaxID=931172 RepID=A0AAV6UF22_9ARAC|nr:hypothetical protein JTE90_010119 [Oedothorax gibbosus]